MRIVNVSKSYEKKVLDNINLEFNKCGLYLIHGESGTGKSTLFRIINGLEKPDEGFVEIASNESISYCSSDNQLIEHIKVKDMLAILSNDLDKINNLLDIFEIKSLKRKKINKLSSGERERLQIVLTLLKDTNVIFLDEPTENLDNKTTIKVLNYLKELSKDKIIVLISHDIKNVFDYTEQVYLLENACLIEEKNYQSFKEPIPSTNKELNKKGLIKYSFKNLFKHPIIMMLNLLLIFTIYLVLGYVFLLIGINNTKTYESLSKHMKYPVYSVSASDEEANKYHLLKFPNYVGGFNIYEYEKVKDYLDLDNPYNLFVENYNMEAFEYNNGDIVVPCIIESGFKYKNNEVKLGNVIHKSGYDYYFQVVGILNQEISNINDTIIISSKLDKFLFEKCGVQISVGSIFHLTSADIDTFNTTFGDYRDVKYIDDITDIKSKCIPASAVTYDYEGYFYVGEFPKNDNEIMLNQPYLYASLNENNKINLLNDDIKGEYAGINNQINNSVYDDLFKEPLNGLKITGTIGYISYRYVSKKNLHNIYVSHDMYEKMCESLKENDYHSYKNSSYYVCKDSFKYMTSNEYLSINYEYKNYNYNLKKKFIETIALDFIALIMILVELIFIKTIFDDTLRDIHILKLYKASNKDIKIIIVSTYFVKSFFRIIGYILGVLINYNVLKYLFTMNYDTTPVFNIWFIILAFIISLSLSLLYEVGMYKLRRNKVLSKHE